jgi:hypothetical protein
MLARQSNIIDLTSITMKRRVDADEGGVPVFDGKHLKHSAFLVDNEKLPILIIHHMLMF